MNRECDKRRIQTMKKDCAFLKPLKLIVEDNNHANYEFGICMYFTCICMPLLLLHFVVAITVVDLLWFLSPLV